MLSLSLLSSVCSIQQSAQNQLRLEGELSALPDTQMTTQQLNKWARYFPDNRICSLSHSLAATICTTCLLRRILSLAFFCQPWHQSRSVACIVILWCFLVCVRLILPVCATILIVCATIRIVYAAILNICLCYYLYCLSCHSRWLYVVFATFHIVFATIHILFVIMLAVLLFFRLKAIDAFTSEMCGIQIERVTDDDIVVAVKADG